MRRAERWFRGRDGAPPWRRGPGAGATSVWAFGLVFIASSAGAQVIELDAQGRQTIYAGAMVFTEAGARPLVPRTPTSSAGLIRRSAERFAPAAAAARLSPDLLAAVAWRESRFSPGARSRVGALGEMQLMPSTARDLRVDPRNDGQNLMGGAAYLAELLHRYDGDLVRALAAYNAGPGRVDRDGGVPPILETRSYVEAILERLSQAAEEAPERPR